MDKINTLEIDIETFSDADLGKCGVYRYTESPCFEILLFGYSVNDGPVQVVDLASGEDIPDNIINALTDNSVIKWAHNASFERICLSAWLRKCKPSKFAGYCRSGDFVGNYLDPAGWRCSMVWSAYMGLPLSLKDVGAVLKLEDQKLSEGKDLVRYFCIPCRPTATNSGRTRNMPSDAPADWALFKKYNARDVEVEQSITHRLSKHPVPESVWEEYHISEEINDRGIGIDITLVDNAIDMDARSRQELMDAMREITELENPNSAAQLKDWLCKCGLEIETLGKKEVAAIIKEAPPELQKVLSLRLQLSKSSVKKYQAMHNCVCADGRARGMFFFYGANRTGRFSGRLLQLQNLYRNDLPDLESARELVKSGDYDAVQMLYEDVPGTLSQLIRTALVPSEGHQFYVADFSAIEARVIAWLAGEQWRMDLFRNGGDIYCQSASQMFKVPVVKHGVNGHLRQKGKIAELACGYGGSVGALKAMGALEMGLKEEELSPLVKAWRESNPHIVQLWWEVENAAITAITEHSTSETHGLVFTWCKGMLFVTLPSGRQLAYARPRVGTNQYGASSISYYGVDGTKKWNQIETFGGKLVENIIQAIARDVLCYTMKTLKGYFICAHVHDEVIIEAGVDVSLDEICELMGRTPPWAEGLILKADGYTTPWYKKD